MNSYIANTDYDWYKFLSSRPDLEEVNFWKPLGETNFKALSTGEPLIFKLKKEFNHFIVGFGLFVMFKPIRCIDAWEVFGEGNGAESFERMLNRISTYLKKFNRPVPGPSHFIGSILLTAPIFFPKDLWIKGPSDWKGPIVTGKGYDTKTGEGKRIWQECLARATALNLNETANYNIAAIKEAPARYGTERLIKPRLGQGTFRFVLERAYQKCAVTREHSLPALEAAHIHPYKLNGPHETSNGLLLRADIHKLFDRGYVTVTPDYSFKVSEKLKEEFHNGKIYYELQNSKIWLPKNPVDRPSPTHLEYHNTEIFERS